MPAGIYKRNLKSTVKAGQKFNKLTAIKFDYKDKHRNCYWLFRCDCGKEKVICINNVKTGHTKSCGCLYKGINTKHGMTKTRTFKSWHSMKNRCLNKKATGYNYWGGRGITIHPRWITFENFYEDMGEMPEGKSLDRIDNNGNYTPKNCKWSNSKEQNNNTRRNHFLTYKNKTLTVSQWAEELGIKRDSIYLRLSRGWSIEKALTFNL